MNDTYTVRRATMDDVKDIHALLMDSARKGLLLPRALIFLYGHVRNFLVIDDPRGGLAACCALAPVWEDLAEVCSLAVPPSALISSATFRAAASFRSRTATLAPADTSALENMAQRMPPAPVTTATLPRRSVFRGNFIEKPPFQVL